jgi:transcriptional regulator with XRE-family HTH domain
MNTEVLKLIRILAKFSQAELAEKIGVHQSLISKIEAGTATLQPETERKIKQVFHDAGISEFDIALLAGIIHKSRKDDAE